MIALIHLENIHPHLYHLRVLMIKEKNIKFQNLFLKIKLKLKKKKHIKYYKISRKKQKNIFSSE